MFTYKFFVTKSGKLGLRLRDNGKKTEIQLFYDTTQAELDETIALLQGRRGTSRLKTPLAFYKAKLSHLADDLIFNCQTEVDVMVIRKMVEQAFHLPSNNNSKFSTCFSGDKTPIGNFFQQFNEYIDRKENLGTKGLYKRTLSKILDFDKTAMYKSFDEINLKWLTDFESFCAKTATKNARNIHLRNIRAVFNNAIDYNITSAYPFRRFKIRPEPTRKRSLTIDELRMLFSYKVEPYMQIYLDMFKLIFMLIGINVVDLYNLHCITSKGYIEYKRAKTGRLYSIKVEPEAMEIITKYRGVSNLLMLSERWNNHANFLHQINKALQRIGTIERKGRGGKKIIHSEFPQLTTYAARHLDSLFLLKVKHLRQALS